MSGSWLLAFTRTVLYLAFTIALMPIQVIAVALDWQLAHSLPRFYHARAMRILGFEIHVRGTPSTARPTLFVSNHSSYFDIEVLGSLLEASFIAKADMMGWPFIGTLAKLQRSVFVDRRPQNVGEHRKDVASRLADGDQLVLFAEGTTSDGNRVLPFKSALFSVAAEASPERPLTIQPVSIVATALDGMPLGRTFRPIYAWYGDMPLAPHAWTALSLGSLRVEVEFHPPFTANSRGRKELAERCWAAVNAGVMRSITGRGSGLPNKGDGDGIAEEGAEIEAAA